MEIDNASWQARIANYHRVSGFPKSLFIADDGRVVGTWIMGNDYRVKSKFHGGYPATYLRRMRALFFDKQRALHLFSGKVDLTAFPGDTIDIVPEHGPTFVDDAHTLEKLPLDQYDLVLADPPYSEEDAKHYGTPMIDRARVLRALTRLSSGAHVVWLDQVHPMYRKADWRLELAVGMIRSTNHRYREIAGFRRC